MSIDNGQNNKHRISDLEKGLYSRNTAASIGAGGSSSNDGIRPPGSVTPLTPLRPHEIKVRDDWGTPDPEYFEDDKPNPHIFSKFAIRFFYFALFFLMIAVTTAVLIYYRGSNVISSDNIEINFAGPISVAGGQELDLDIDVKNLNTTTLETTDMKVEFPDGTRSPTNSVEEQKRVDISYGAIAPGVTVTKNVRAVLYGEENSKQKITADFVYRVKGSNATFEKKKDFEILLTNAPISISVDSLKEVNSNQELELTVNLVSNSAKTINNIMLRADYAFGFVPSSFSPQPYSGKNTWYVGDMKPGDKKTVKVRGKLEGQDGEERAFRFSVGIQSQNNKTELEPVFLTVPQKVAIKKPFIGIDLAFDGNNSSVYVAEPGKSINSDITWSNNLPDKVSSLRIIMKLNGIPLDKSSVRVTNGFYRSYDDTIVWDPSTENNLSLANPGDNGRVGFTFTTLVPRIETLSILKNPELNFEVSVVGKRSEGPNVPEEILSTVKRRVRLSTNLRLNPRIVYSFGPFKNTGSIPPKAEKETTYTVTLTASNTINDARDVKVTATLPTYVVWKNAISPANEDLTHDANSNQITWNLGDVSAGAGYQNSERRVSFQISFTPSISQVGLVPVLVNDIKIEGIDRFTNTSIGVMASDLTTKTVTDPKYRSGDEAVVY